MLILASNSPRRKELITEYITSDFLIIPSSVNETYDDSKSIEDNIIHIANSNSGFANRSNSCIFNNKFRTIY